MIVPLSFFFYGPLVLVGIVACGAAAVQVLRGTTSSRDPFVLAQLASMVLWAVGCAFALVDRIAHRDWQHLFWSAQIPLVGSFLVSGVLLSRTWREDAEVVGPVSSDDEPERRRPRLSGAWLFLLMSSTLGLAPLVLQIALPNDSPAPRESGAPVRRLWDLAAWGFGGAMPESLTPIRETARGIGYLPREVTVPMGTTLIAAWLWIAFCALALGGRLVRSRPKRIAFYLVAPPLAALCAQLGLGDLLSLAWDGFDPDFFGPASCEASGIWTSDPAVLRSYGPVLLTSCIAALVLLLTLAWQRAPSAPLVRG